jgi:hypothetical protein
MRRLLALVILLASVQTFADTAFTANLKPLAGAQADSYAVGLKVQNCANYLLRVTMTAGTFTLIDDTVYLHPGGGLISATIPDEAAIACGSSASAANYNVCIVAWDKIRNAPVLPAKRCNDYDITGPSFNLNNATPRSAPAPAAIANAVLTNPSANQRAVQPPGTSLVIAGESALAGDFSISFENPAVGDSGKFQHKIGYDGKITRISCSTDSGTVAINLEVRSEATPNSAGTAVLAVALSCTSSTASTTTFSAATFAANAPIALMIPNSSGAGLIRVHVHVQPQ